MERIVQAKRATIDIDTGNITEKEWKKWSYIEQDGVKVSSEYESIRRIYESEEDLDSRITHYIVAKYDNFHKYYGVIAVRRDEEGQIVPNSDTLIIPYLYSDIKPGGLKTLIGSNLYKGTNYYTYIDINSDSNNYGEQLVPVLLTSALSFEKCDNDIFLGFARCTYKGKSGYLARNMEPIYDNIQDSLIDQAMVDYLTSSTDSVESIKTIAKAIHQMEEEYGDLNEILKIEQILNRMTFPEEKTNNKQFIKRIEIDNN